MVWTASLPASEESSGIMLLERGVLAIQRRWGSHLYLYKGSSRPQRCFKGSPDSNNQSEFTVITGVITPGESWLWAVHKPSPSILPSPLLPSLTPPPPPFFNSFQHLNHPDPSSLATIQFLLLNFVRDHPFGPHFSPSGFPGTNFECWNIRIHHTETMDGRWPGLCLRGQRDCVEHSMWIK